jgi:hypothetical protein
MMASYGIKTVNKLVEAYTSLNMIALRKEYTYLNQIDLYFLDNILIVIKKELCSNKKYRDIFKEIYDILNVPEVHKLFTIDDSLVDGYKIKEKIFYYLVRKKKMRALYLITKIVTYGEKV